MHVQFYLTACSKLIPPRFLAIAPKFLEVYFSDGKIYLKKNIFSARHVHYFFTLLIITNKLFKITCIIFEYVFVEIIFRNIK